MSMNDGSFIFFVSIFEAKSFKCLGDFNSSNYLVFIQVFVLIRLLLILKRWLSVDTIKDF